MDTDPLAPLPSTADVPVESHLLFEIDASWPGLETAETTFFEWPISSWAQLRSSTKVHSDYFTCAGHKWRLLLFPNGNNVDHTSVFLEMDKPNLAPDQAVCAQFYIGMRNPNDETIHSHMASNHRFDEATVDWGFNKFIPIVDLTKPIPPSTIPSTPLFTIHPPSYKLSELTTTTTNNNNIIHLPLIENDKTVLYCFIRTLKDETGVLWHNFRNYDSKKTTGYVGLKNQGATCYMNSILQSLFCTNLFRKAVYQIPYEADSNTTDKPSVTVALQRLFYFLQTGNGAIGTHELTKSFGWNTRDAFAQHDVQEFNRVLTDNLEEKMKGTLVDGSIQSLFVGKMKSYIRCINVDYESSRIEDFYDIQLNVKGCKALEDSFHDYIQVETLDGENKYKTDDYGLQDARKGVIFEKMPPVLHLQLKRFDYDMYRDMMVKINDRFEFPLEFDIEPFLSEAADKSQPHRYHLHGVLVHSGSLDAGHYFAFVKPTADSKWLKFDDDKVVPISIREVLEESYGGDMEPSAAAIVSNKDTPPRVNQRATIQKRFTNAYMLVYIRESERDKVLEPVTTSDVPHHILEALEKERIAEEDREKELREREFMLSIRIIDDSTFKHHSGFDLANFDNKDMPLVQPIFDEKFNKKEVTWAQCKTAITQTLGVDPTRVRFWILTTRKNKTLRPDGDNLLQDVHDSMTLERLKRDFNENVAPYELRLYMETSIPFKDDQLFPPPYKPGSKILYVMIFIKVYLPLEGQLSGVGHIIVDNYSPIKDSESQINEALGWPVNTSLLMWEEVHHKMYDAVKPKQTWHSGDLGNGDIICVQKDYSKQEMSTWPKRVIKNAYDYYNFMNSQVTVVFRPYPKLHDDDKVYDTFQLILSRNQSYDDVVELVAEKIGLEDPLKLRLWSASWNDTPKSPIRRTPTTRLSEMFSSFPANMNIGPTLIYETMEVSITELETKRIVKINFLVTPMKEEVYGVLVLRTGTISQLLQALQAKLKDHDKHCENVRLYEVTSHRISREFNGDEPVSLIQDYISLYAEETPEEELHAGEGDKAIMCVHISKHPMALHGVPFNFVVKKDEQFSSIKKRLQERLGLGDKEFARITFSIIAFGAVSLGEPIADDEVLAQRDNWASYSLALNHPERRTAKASGFEKAIKIFN